LLGFVPFVRGEPDRLTPQTPLDFDPLDDVGFS